MTHVELLEKMLKNYEMEREKTSAFSDDTIFYSGCIFALDEAIQALVNGIKLKED